VFLTKTADDGKVSVIFGTGREGARLPSGSDNVRAVYRSGIGKAGNVRATQLATAVSRPLGVRDAINPLPATGGADPESRDDARRNVPMATQALGRVVSVRDYADFARTFAGIAKASAVLLSDGRTRLVHLTIGGTGDIDITPQSDLFLNLVAALRKYGDPYQPFRIESRQKLVVAGNAAVRVDRDYLWSAVQPRVQAALLDAFSYDRRAFGQPLFPSEVVAAIQRVAGVESVDLLALGSISEEQVFVGEDGDSPQAAGPWHGLPAITTVAPIVPKLAQADPIRPAQIAYLPPDLAELFILTEDPR
jgi:predicted phage baseplate assembly protein